MRKIFLFCIIIIIVISCGEPSPTELIFYNKSENTIQIEPALNDNDANLNSSGYDTTGIFNPFLSKSTIINITGVRNTNYGIVQNEGYYYAIFNDKSKPVKVKNGKLIGYKSKNISSVKFNNYEAVKIPHVIHYVDRMMVKDTTLGIKYFFKQRMMQNGQMHDFPFFSKVNVKVVVDRNSFAQIDVFTPPEIIGKVSLEGNRLRKNLNIILEWNKKSEDNVEIIIARFRQSSSDAEPLLKLKGNEIGKIKLPFNILENIITDQNKFLIISFVRKYEKLINHNILDDTYIVTQSIHNIKIEIP
ncbi:hypothetical protein [Rosettibacter primus]|uniref:hypothetical protein n=1 Tax=Rosettibacter primus TaxID=3111523 RepID=UPI00336C211B